ELNCSLWWDLVPPCGRWSGARMPPDGSHPDIHHSDAGLRHRCLILPPGNKWPKVERPHRRIELNSFVTRWEHTHRIKAQSQRPFCCLFFDRGCKWKGRVKEA